MNRMKEYATHYLPRAETPERPAEARAKGLNATFVQLSILCANLGNLSRPTKIAAKECRSKDPVSLADFFWKKVPISSA